MSDITDRSNGQVIDETWFNILKEEIEENEAQITLLATGPSIVFDDAGYYAEGGARLGLMYYQTRQAITLLDALLTIITQGSSGSTTPDVMRSTAGGAFASIFTTKPSVPSTAGALANSATGAGATAAILNGSHTALAVGDVLRLDLSAVQAGVAGANTATTSNNLCPVTPKGFILNLKYKVTGMLLE